MSLPRKICLPTVLVFVLLLVWGAARADSLYDVTNVMVDTTAKDAVTARQMGMDEAGRRAIYIVLKRLVPPGVEPHLPPLSKDAVEGMVSGISIRSEQNSTTRYVARLDVSFNERAVKQFLMDQGIPYSEARAPTITVLPLVIEGDKVTSEGTANWRQAWEDLDLAHSVTPITILRPRETLDTNTVQAALAGEGDAMSQLQSDYGYAPLVIALGQPADGSFAVQLAGQDATGPISVTVTGGQQQAAAANALTALENRWKMQGEGGLPAGAGYENGPMPSPGQEGAGASPAAPGEVARSVVAVVEFTGLKNWQDIRARLAQIAGIQSLEVNALSARTASISFDYAGSLGHLQSALGQSGLSFDERGGTFVLRSQ